MALLVGCSEAHERYPLTIAGERLLVEVADTPESRQVGLMHRTELGERHGMLFVFDESAHRTFWMKDTHVPLSIAYIDERWTIREILDMEPLSLEPVPSRVPVRYALEVNRNTFERLGIRVGARVVISDELRERMSR
jgi:uncharacterized protein